MYEAQGQYSFAKSKAPTGKFGTSERKYEVGRASENPGPGNYNSDIMKKGNAPSYKFGIKTTSKTSDAPGPGAYEPNIHSARDRA